MFSEKLIFKCFWSFSTMQTHAAFCWSKYTTLRTCSFVLLQAFHGHTVRGWDVRPECLDKVHERLAYEKKKLKEDGLMIRPDFLVWKLCLYRLNYWHTSWELVNLSKVLYGFVFGGLVFRVTVYDPWWPHKLNPKNRRVKPKPNIKNCNLQWENSFFQNCTLKPHCRGAFFEKNAP